MFIIREILEGVYNFLFTVLLYSDMYHVETEDFQFHVQEFIEGVMLKENTAPEWFLEKSADILGKIHSVTVICLCSA